MELVGREGKRLLGHESRSICESGREGGDGKGGRALMTIAPSPVTRHLRLVQEENEKKIFDTRRALSHLKIRRIFLLYKNKCVVCTLGSRPRRA